MSAAQKEEAPRVPVRQRWLQARTSRDFTAVEHIGESILRVAPDDEPVRRALARLFTEQEQHERALPHWIALRDRNPDDFEAAFHVGKAAIAGGMAMAAALKEAAPSGSSALHGHLALVLEAPPCGTELDRRHIAICGVSYCGSTLMDRLLGGLPGVRSIGESHWLIKARYEHGYDLANFASDTPPKFVPCSVCGARCQVLTPDFRRALAADRTGWYFRIAQQFGTKSLISADKNAPKLVDNDPLMRFSALVMFKTPQQAWKSQLDKLPVERDEEFYRSQCEKYLKVWASSYDIFLNHFRPTGNVAFVCFDAFAAAPEPALATLCESLNLPNDSRVARTTTPGHAIGGNKGAMDRLRQNGYMVEIKPLPPPNLPSEHIRLIEDHAEANKVYAQLAKASAPAERKQ